MKSRHLIGCAADNFGCEGEILLAVLRELSDVSQQLLPQRDELPFYHIPDERCVNGVEAMHKHVAHTYDVGPFHFWMRSAKLIGELVCRLAYHLYVVNDGIVDNAVTAQLLIIGVGREADHLVDSLHHVLQTATVFNCLSHR